MSDLIKRNAAIEEILECCPSDFDNEYDCGYDDGLRQAVHKLKHLPSAGFHQEIKNAPTADVVEVVHCKDCSWCQLKRIRRKKFDALFECILWEKPTSSEFYCAAGERREDE